DDPLPTGAVHRVAVTRKSVGLVDGKPKDRIRGYANGREVINFTIDPDTVIGATGPLEMGRWRSDDGTYGLRGVLCEVRIWSVARTQADLGRPVDPKSRNLVARWQFPEGRGNATTDASEKYRARLRGATWVRNPDPQASELALYHDGAAAAF